MRCMCCMRCLYFMHRYLLSALYAKYGIPMHELYALHVRSVRHSTIRAASFESALYVMHTVACVGGFRLPDRNNGLP